MLPPYGLDDMDCSLDEENTTRNCILFTFLLYSEIIKLLTDASAFFFVSNFTFLNLSFIFKDNINNIDKPFTVFMLLIGT